MYSVVLILCCAVECSIIYSVFHFNESLLFDRWMMVCMSCRMKEWYIFPLRTMTWLSRDMTAVFKNSECWV